MLRAVVIDCHTAIEHPEIREHADCASTSAYTRRYLLLNSDSEVGFMSLDLIPEGEQAVLYDLWIARDARNRGFGTKAVRAAERIAAEEGFRRILLIPKPTDGGNAARLRSWYISQGYEETWGLQGQLQKPLDQT